MKQVQRITNTIISLLLFEVELFSRAYLLSSIFFLYLGGSLKNCFSHQISHILFDWPRRRWVFLFLRERRRGSAGSPSWTDAGTRGWLLWCVLHDALPILVSPVDMGTRRTIPPTTRPGIRSAGAPRASTSSPPLKTKKLTSFLVNQTKYLKFDVKNDFFTNHQDTKRKSKKASTHAKRTLLQTIVKI